MEVCKNKNRETGVGRETREVESGGCERGKEGGVASEGNKRHRKYRCI